MGSSRACAPENSFVAAYSLPYKLDMKIFGGEKGSISSLSGSSERVLADLGLTITGAPMEANSFKNHTIISKANSMHAHANPADIKALKKPDKTLPCPRCNSLETKFCYYNNYNINQPRHFCKGCQRYWTAGGTLRNVAVGAGRRKRKHASLDSDSQDSAVEDCNSHELSSVKVLGDTDSGSAKAEFSYGRPELVKPQMFPFGATVSNPPSLNMKQSSFSEYIHPKRHDKVESLCNSHTFKEQAGTFYEYLPLKQIEAPPDMLRTPYSSHELACEAVYVEKMKTRTFNLLMDLQHNECSDMGSKFVRTTSSDRQASNESGCASSLSTQAVSVDACVTDGKSEAMDSEVTKEGDELDKGGSYVNKILQSAHILPCKVNIDGGGSATSNFGQCDASSVGTLAPTLKGPLENPAFKAVWPMISPALTWGPSADRVPLCELPWGPSANAVDAAKAALIPKVGSSQKHQTEPNLPTEKRLWIPKSLRIKDADEAVRSSIWSILGIKDRQGSVLSEKVEAVFQCHAKAGGTPVAQTQHASPVAMTQSVAFQESS